MKTQMFVAGKKLNVEFPPDTYPNPHVHSGTYRNEDGHTIRITRGYTLDDLRREIKYQVPHVAILDTTTVLTFNLLRRLVDANREYVIRVICEILVDVTKQNAREIAHDMLISVDDADCL